jgi:glycosyltransferase involved in cell wall biosynthesis
VTGSLARRGARSVARRFRDATSALAAAALDLLERDRRDRLLILDDTLPSQLSSFRVAEYNGYLAHFPQAEVHSTAALLGEGKTFRQLLADYDRRYPQVRERIRRFHPGRVLRGKGAYTVFLNNAVGFIDVLDKSQLPFAFTLYPGGGFRLDDPESDEKLRRVLSSRFFRKVIVTQPVTLDYLKAKGLCPAERIEFAFGLVVPTDLLGSSPVARRRFGIDKDTLDVCFVAHKYMPRGIDKGYDSFAEVACRLANRGWPVRFHVVGSFSPSDAEVGPLGDRIAFYGPRSTDFFAGFYAGMDLIVSPNVPFVLAPGAFDGFPTGACVEAALSGTAVFCTDQLGQNQGRFANSREIAIVPRTPGAICERIEEYLARPEALASLGERGAEAFRRVYDLDLQMGPRLRAMSELAGAA